MRASQERAEALATIAEIAVRHALAPAEIARYLEQEQVRTHRRGELITRLFGYLGSTFVFAGLVVFISMYWPSLGSIERIIVTLGSGLIAYVVGIASSRDCRYQRAATALFLIAGLLQPTGMLVAIAEYSQGGDPRHAMLLVLAVMIISFGATFWKEQRSVLLFLTLAYAAGWLATAFNLLGLQGEYSAITTGGFLTAAAYLVARTQYAAVAGFWFFVGSGLALGAAFSLLEYRVTDVAFLGLACFYVYLSLLVASRPLLFNGTLAVLSFLGYYSAEYFANIGGWPLAMLAMGAALIGLGRAVLELDRRFMRGTATKA